MTTSKWWRYARLYSGLYILLFIAGHLVVLSMGLHSLEMMDAYGPVLMGVLGNPVLLLALIVHIVMGLHHIATRKYHGVPLREWLQVGPALLVPILLFDHAASIFILIQADLPVPKFSSFLLLFWELQPILGLKQIAVLVFAWVHGTQGLLNWLRFKPWWPKLRLVTNIIVSVLPACALLGFLNAGDLLFAFDSSSAHGELREMSGALTGFQEISRQFFTIYCLIVLGVFAYRAGRHYLAVKKTGVRVEYETGQLARGFVGSTLLDVSRNNHIDHKHECNGQGRCFTCRVEVLDGAEALSPRVEIEQKLKDPSHRLACHCFIQDMPTQQIKIRRLVKENFGSDYLQLWNKVRMRPISKRQPEMTESDGG